MKTREGKFTISHRMIERNANIVRHIMRDVIVLDLRIDTLRDETTYLGLHPDFDMIEAGETIPKYECILHPTEDGYRQEWRPSGL